MKIFLKRYDRPPILQQIRNWLLHHRRRSFASVEREAIEHLAAAGVGVPRVVGLRRAMGNPLRAKKLPDDRGDQGFAVPGATAARRVSAILRHARSCGHVGTASAGSRSSSGDSTTTGRRHRDLYLSHIFCSDAGEFCLIDLARASQPVLHRRFQIKDIAQLHYSVAGKALLPDGSFAVLSGLCRPSEAAAAGQGVSPCGPAENREHGASQRQTRGRAALPRRHDRRALNGEESCDHHRAGRRGSRRSRAIHARSRGRPLGPGPGGRFAGRQGPGRPQEHPLAVPGYPRQTGDSRRLRQSPATASRSSQLRHRPQRPAPGFRRSLPAARRDIRRIHAPQRRQLFKPDRHASTNE